MKELIQAHLFYLDVDECSTGEQKCHSQTTRCKNNLGGYTCPCKRGYQPGQSAYECQGNCFYYYKETVNKKPRPLHYNGKTTIIYFRRVSKRIFKQ